MIANDAATPSIALRKRSLPTVGETSAGNPIAGREGSSDSTSINARFRPGTKKSSASHGLVPASTARRIVMLTPIHRNGSAMATIRGRSHAGPPCKRR